MTLPEFIAAFGADIRAFAAVAHRNYRAAEADLVGTGVSYEQAIVATVLHALAEGGCPASASMVDLVDRMRVGMVAARSAGREVA